MRALKKVVFLFGLIVLIIAVNLSVPQEESSSPQVSHPAQVLGAAVNVSLFEQPEDGRVPILTALQSAKREIDIEVYELSDKQIIAALENAKSRGIIVKVLLEHHPFGSSSFNDTVEQQLQHDAIMVKWTNPVFALTHEKSIIIDANEVLILNQNLTASSFYKNREYDILDSNPQDISQTKTIFTDDWQRQTFTPTDSHLIVSPVTARSALTALLQQAQKSIAIEMEVIDDPQIIALLCEKAKKDQVHIIIPDFKTDPSNRDAAERMEAAGAQVRTISSPYVHAKLLITDDATAYIGSINLTTQSMDRNRELGIILTQQEILQRLTTDYVNDWAEASSIQ